MSMVIEAAIIKEDEPEDLLPFASASPSGPWAAASACHACPPSSPSQTQPAQLNVENGSWIRWNKGLRRRNISFRPLHCFVSLKTLSHVRMWLVWEKRKFSKIFFLFTLNPVRAEAANPMPIYKSRCGFDQISAGNWSKTFVLGNKKLVCIWKTK